MTPTDNHPWWERGVVYQVYPRSFQDSDGDGVGDLAGIERRLDYLAALGIDAIWLSPIFPSPMADFGYDVADYCGIEPLFGTMADFDRLLAAAHARGLKLLLDFVPNHTAPDHPWVTKHPEYYIHGSEQDLASAPQNYARLKALKTQYDPTNLFRMNLNIPPDA